MNAPLPQHITASLARSDTAFDLTRIFEADIQIAQWDRPEQALITAWLDQHLARLGSGLRQTLARGERPDLAALPPGAGRDAFAADLAMLADMLAELVDAKTIGLRVEVVHRAMCPRFHVDRVGLRMLCTYRGEGTEWVDNRWLDRRLLGGGEAGVPDEASGLLLPGHRIERIPPFAVALLKGTLWQGNGGRGVVHRTPAVEAPTRVLVALDAGS